MERLDIPTSNLEFEEESKERPIQIVTREDKTESINKKKKMSAKEKRNGFKRKLKRSNATEDVDAIVTNSESSTDDKAQDSVLIKPLDQSSN